MTESRERGGAAWQVGQVGGMVVGRSGGRWKREWGWGREEKEEPGGERSAWGEECGVRWDPGAWGPEDSVSGLGAGVSREEVG